MTTPAFVGIGPVTSSTSPPWPGAGLTITSGKEPSGITVGDRVFLFCAFQSPYGSPFFDHFNCSNAGWAATSPAFGRHSYGSGSYVGVYAWTARWTPSLLPTTVAPKQWDGSAMGDRSGSNDRYRCYLAAWTPSQSSTGGTSSTASGGSYLPRTSPAYGTGTFTADGLAVMVGHASMAVYSSGTLNGFTARVNRRDAPSWSTDPDLIIADKPFVGGDGGYGPYFDTTLGISGGVLLLRLDSPDPPIRRPRTSVGILVARA